MKFKIGKESFFSKLANLIYNGVVEVVGKSGVKPENIVIDHPASPEHGDYSTNIALRLKRPAEFQTPFDLANAIVNAIRSAGLPEYLGKIEVVMPGFINIWLQNESLVNQANKVLEEKETFGGSEVLNGKKFLLEHTSPNPQTTIMLGHLRNNFLGMTMSRIFEFMGAKITRDCIVNDRGVHLCRAIWGYLVFGQKRGGLKKAQLQNFRKVTEDQIRPLAKVNWQELLVDWKANKAGWWEPADLGLKPDHSNLIWYVLGSRAYGLLEGVKKQVEEILLAWEEEDKKVREIWRQILDWSAKGYEETYKRIGSVHDRVWYESDHYQQGKDIVKEGMAKKVFRESEGAIVTDLAKYGLPDTIVQKSDGTALYITQDLALTKLKMTKFPSDWYIWDIGSEQTLYFKQLFAICEQLGIGKKEQFFHLGYALINFKGGGKMATRKGDVVKADGILDELKSRALEIIKKSNQELRGKLSSKQLDDLAEKVAVGAIKYSMQKFSRDTTIYFDIDESLALEGNSGPYLQYTFSRCRSVLSKAKISNIVYRISNIDPEPEEFSLLRTIYRFPEVVAEAGENFAPNLLCNYLYDLAQKFNLFYNKHQILKAGNPELVEGRLGLTAAVAQILVNGLTLLGIETPERM